MRRFKYLDTLIIVFVTLTYAVVYGLKHSEGVDAFDDHADCNPFLFGWRRAAQPEQAEGDVA